MIIFFPRSQNWQCTSQQGRSGALPVQMWVTFISKHVGFLRVESSSRKEWVCRADSGSNSV